MIDKIIDGLFCLFMGLCCFLLAILVIAFIIGLLTGKIGLGF